MRLIVRLLISRFEPSIAFLLLSPRSRFHLITLSVLTFWYCCSGYGFSMYEPYLD